MGDNRTKERPKERGGFRKAYDKDNTGKAKAFIAEEEDNEEEDYGDQEDANYFDPDYDEDLGEASVNVVTASGPQCRAKHLTDKYAIIPIYVS